MSKRFTDTTIWKKQRWFKKLNPTYKLVFKYLTDECDISGMWKIDFDTLLDDIGLDEFDLAEFMLRCNEDTDKLTGRKIHRPRLLLVNGTQLWLTGFIKFQYESKDGKIKITFNMAKSALELLARRNLFQFALSKNFFQLSEPFRNLPEASEPFPEITEPFPQYAEPFQQKQGVVEPIEATMVENQPNSEDKEENTPKIPPEPFPEITEPFPQYAEPLSENTEGFRTLDHFPGKGKGIIYTNSTIELDNVSKETCGEDEPHHDGKENKKFENGLKPENSQGGNSAAPIQTPTVAGTPDSAPHVAPPPPKKRKASEKAERRKTVIQQLTPIFKNIYTAWYKSYEGKPYVWQFGKCDTAIRISIDFFLTYALDEFRGMDPTDDQVIARTKTLFSSMLTDWDKVRNDKYFGKTDICNMASQLNNITSLQNSSNASNQKSFNSSGKKLGTSDARVEALRNWGVGVGTGNSAQRK